MSIVLDGTTGITAPAIDAALDATDLTGNIAAARITDALNASGSAPLYAARAWVNFDGTGTVAIRASGNVSSITDNGTGLYTVNITTAMPDANYATVCTVGGVSQVYSGSTSNTVSTTSTVQVSSSRTTDNVAADPSRVSVAIFR
jgi:hypothetical protein